MMKFSVAKDFSRTPSARTEEEGKHPGMKLRKLLVPLLEECIRNNDKIEINLDGTAGYGTSFLEETFGGLIRNEKFKISDLKNILSFKTEDEPELKDEIWDYIEDAHRNEKV